MNSVIFEHTDKAYGTQMGRARIYQNIPIVPESILIQIHYNSPVYGDKEVKHYGKG